ncbi:hypothetical protein BpHYR1_007008, partial [Brachionus plicatilis]
LRYHWNYSIILSLASSTLETELRRIKVNQLIIRQARVKRQLNHRENLIPLAAENTRTRREDGTSYETLNHVSMEAQRQRERRANETPKENERRLRQQREYRVRTRKEKTEERLNRK